ncbi:HPr family phosphocarrier protein [Catenovulum sp. SM1970]|uniref:HPr family phosphocarrier protein n=1 Tax=Marinifaba aquimaris TaxID=2741323 RepID=UPI0015730B80|nr:HPr family phosphocarrier protein [Marinifaba aquimaris]NTS75886.1 HPr family phosphocarrier protein [Marinifaba aquimaris]
MITRTLTITNKLGLHARAATKLAELAMQFKSEVTIHCDNKQAKANSVMGLLMLAGAQGKQIEVSSDGADAQAALDAIAQLIEAKFEEED